MEVKDELIKNLEKKITQLSINMERMKIADYVELLERPSRLLFRNFIGGIARGVGVAVGFTLLGAMLIVFLQRLELLNLPVIGEFIAEIVQIVQLNLGTRP